MEEGGYVTTLGLGHATELVCAVTDIPSFRHTRFRKPPYLVVVIVLGKWFDVAEPGPRLVRSGGYYSLTGHQASDVFAFGEGNPCRNLVCRGSFCWFSVWRGMICWFSVCRGSPNLIPAESPSPNAFPADRASPNAIPARDISPNEIAADYRPGALAIP